jgi:hypothetical protein
MRDGDMSCTDRLLRVGLLLTASTMIAWLSAGRCVAQSAHQPNVPAAAYDLATPVASGQSVRFGRREPLVGDQLEQNLSVTLQLDTMVRQDREVLEKTKTALSRHQRRIVTTTHVNQGMAVAVLVRYAAAAKEIATGSAEGKLGEAKLAAQPVRGKAYRVCRDGESLLITDEQGAVPPLDEYEIVALNMESLGRPNPLADFLAGQSLSIGQRITLPNEVAEKLMGLGGEMGKVTRFELTLQSVATINNAACAVFQADIEAASNDSSQMRLAVDGPLAIEIGTCRAVEANFTGPIGMSETRGSLSATYQMMGTGKMSVRIASKYSDLER